MSVRLCYSTQKEAVRVTTAPSTPTTATGWLPEHLASKATTPKKKDIEARCSQGQLCRVYLRWGRETEGYTRVIQVRLTLKQDHGVPNSSLKAAERSAKSQMYREAEVMVFTAQKKEQPRGSSISKAAPIPEPYQTSKLSRRIREKQSWAWPSS